MENIKKNLHELRHRVSVVEDTLRIAANRIGDKGIAVTENILDSLKAAKLARMWAGKLLGYIGEPTPYPESDNAANAVVHPAADYAGMALDLSFGEDNETNIKSLKAVRSHIQTECIDYLLTFMPEMANSLEGFGSICAMNVMGKLTESRLWLGEALPLLI